MLTPEEVQKYKNCLFLESHAPVKAPWSDDTAEQAAFIRAHGDGKLRFYAESFYLSNPGMTTRIYAGVYQEYSKRFNYRNKKYKDAKKRRLELEAKMTTASVVSVRRN